MTGTNDRDERTDFFFFFLIFQLHLTLHGNSLARLVPIYPISFSILAFHRRLLCFVNIQLWQEIPLFLYHLFPTLLIFSDDLVIYFFTYNVARHLSHYRYLFRTLPTTTAILMFCWLIWSPPLTFPAHYSLLFCAPLSIPWVLFPRLSIRFRANFSRRWDRTPSPNLADGWSCGLVDGRRGEWMDRPSLQYSPSCLTCAILRLLFLWFFLSACDYFLAPTIIAWCRLYIYIFRLL